MLRLSIKNWPNSQHFSGKSPGNFATSLQLDNQKLTIINILCFRYAGEGLTFVDFMVYELIDENLLLVPECLRSFPNIREHLQRFERLPQVAAYMRSPEFMKYPINNKMAACLN